MHYFKENFVIFLEWNMIELVHIVNSGFVFFSTEIDMAEWDSVLKTIIRINMIKFMCKYYRKGNMLTWK